MNGSERVLDKALGQLFGEIGSHIMRQINPESNCDFADYDIDSNLSYDQDNYYIELSLPGVKKEDIDINVDGSSVVIKAVRKLSDSGKRIYTKGEIKNRIFREKYDFNMNIDVERIAARLENGILYLTLPQKGKDSTVKKVKIN